MDAARHAAVIADTIISFPRRPNSEIDRVNETLLHRLRLPTSLSKQTTSVGAAEATLIAAASAGEGVFSQ